MPTFILDASALLAFLHREKGHEQVLQALHDGACFISIMNLTEVATKLTLKGIPSNEIPSICLIPRMELLPVTEEIAFQAAALSIEGKALGLSLGDRVCLATGIIHKATVLTAEKIWIQLSKHKHSQIQLIR